MAMIVSVDGPIATIRLNRPEQRNRIEPADLDELESHLDAIDRRPEVRVLRLPQQNAVTRSDEQERRGCSSTRASVIRIA